MILLAIALGQLCNLTMSIYFFQRNFKLERLRINTIKKIAIYSFPIMGSTISLVIRTHADIIILTTLSNPSFIASYGLAMRISNLVALPLQLLNTAIQPTISQLYHNKEINELKHIIQSSTQKIIYISVALTLTSIAIISSWALLFPNETHKELLILIFLLSVGQLSNVATGPCGIILQMTGHQDLVMKITIILVFISLLSGYTAVTLFGGIALAISSMMIMIILNCLLYLQCNRITGINSLRMKRQA